MFEEDITGWFSPSLISVGTMFNDATAWQAKYERKNDGGRARDGPATAFTRRL